MRRPLAHTCAQRAVGNSPGYRVMPAESGPPAPPCCILGGLLHLPKPQFPHIQNEAGHKTSRRTKGDDPHGALPTASPQNVNHQGTL